jgi:hypothetical protein
MWAERSELFGFTLFTRHTRMNCLGCTILANLSESFRWRVMYIQKLLTPIVLSALVIAQGNPAAFAQQTAAQPQQQPTDQAVQQQPAVQPAQQPAAPAGLNNDSIIKMVKAGLSDDLIVSTIGTSPGMYDTSAEGMIALKSAGASDRVVSAMVQKANSAGLGGGPAAPSIPAVASTKILVADGTDVYLAFDEDLSSKTANDGDTVTLVLTEDLKVGEVVVAKAGAKAVGEITNAQKAGMLGKAGELNMRLDYLKVGTAKVHLRGTKGGEGKSGTGGAIALSLLVSPLFLLMKGKEIKVAKGAALHAYVSDDISLPQAM